jgi:hypothetical protein
VIAYVGLAWVAGIAAALLAAGALIGWCACRLLMTTQLDSAWREGWDDAMADKFRGRHVAEAAASRPRLRAVKMPQPPGAAAIAGMHEDPCGELAPNALAADPVFDPGADGMPQGIHYPTEAELHGIPAGGDLEPA